jgi:ribosome-binding protein aMBF1 (putative translation factor)
MKTNKPSSDILNQMLDSIPQSEQEKTDKRMMLAAKIEDAMKSKGWKKKDLMKAMGKKHASEITKWLSGTHNFTADTLMDLERILDISLLNLKKEIGDAA